MASFPVVNGVTTFLPPPTNDTIVNFQQPRSQHEHEHYLVFGFLGTLALICLLQRLYTKHFIVGGLRIDDYLITIAWAASVGLQGVQIWSISIGGLCHHVWEMPIETYEKHMISSYVAATLFIVCNGFSKASLLTFYLRISTHRWYRIAIWATMGFVVCYTIIITALLLFGTSPIAANWDPYLMANGKFINAGELYICIAAANIVSDVILFCLPIPTVMRLNMPLAQKLGAGVMFGIGSVTVATSIVRMIYLPSLVNTTDIPWVAAPANVWVFTEADLFIICGSMPTFRKFFQKFAPKWLGSTSGHSQPSHSQTYTAGSRISRQHRTGYSVFDDTEIEIVSIKDHRDIESQASQGSSPPIVTSVMSEPSISADCGAARGVEPDDASGNSILNTNGGITYTRTFRVQYSTQ